MKKFKNLFLLLYFLPILSSSSQILQASNTNQSIVLLAGTLASVVALNQIFKFTNSLEKDSPLGNQHKVHRYLEDKFSKLQASKDINIPLVARLILRSKGYTPPYKEYDNYIHTAYELAQLDKEQMNMGHIQKAVNEKYGKKIHIIRDEQEIRDTAIHELGHALAIVHKFRNAQILHLVEIETRESKIDGFVSAGHNVSVPITATMYLPEQEWKNQIFVALSGGIAAQVVRDDVSIKDLQVLLSDEGCTGDLNLAYTYAEKIAIQNIFKQSYTRILPFYNDLKQELNMFTTAEKTKIKEDSDKIIAQCYDEAYDFMIEHKAEIKLALDMLLKSGSLSGDYLYNAWKVPKPLYDFEKNI
jgi:hypothetical protein